MVKRCVYCSVEVDSGSVVDMCSRCMNSVWGEKMARTIVENMERERDAGNLELGRVGEVGRDFVSEGPVIEEVSPEELVMEELCVESGVAENL